MYRPMAIGLMSLATIMDVYCRIIVDCSLHNNAQDVIS